MYIWSQHWIVEDKVYIEYYSFYSKESVAFYDEEWRRKF